MQMTKDDMDRAVNEHFMFEATDDLEGVMASLADEIEHEIIPSPVGVQRDHGMVRAYYASLFEKVKGDRVTPIRRLYGDGFVIDETIWHGTIADGAPFLCDGRSGKVDFKLLHVFEFKDGRISREQAWCDLAAIQQQLGAMPA